TRWYNHHDEHNLSLVFRISLEKMFISLKPVTHTLCIVEAVNRENEFLPFEIPVQFFPGCAGAFIIVTIVEFFEVDAHRENINLDQPVLVPDHVHVVLQSKYHLHALQEVKCVIDRMKTHEIRAENSFENIVLPLLRYHPEEFVGWERNVQEESYRNSRNGFANHG